MASTDPTNSIDKVATWEAPYAIHVDSTTFGPLKSPVPIALVVSDAHACIKNPFNGPTATPAAPPSEAQWEIGLFDCFGAPAHALSAFFFPFVNGAYTAHWIGKSALLAGLSLFATYLASIVFACVSTKYAGDLDGSYDHESSDHEEFDKYYGASATCFLLFAISITVLRREVRKVHRIRGSDLEDCCASLWCSCCVVAQMSVHIQKASLKGSADTATLPAYSSA